ncbi:MAG: response regulator [Candidatus Kapabacteria bacterium]|nr:response regulator [Candidatus Kapabacteria bacterium]
MLLVGDEQSIIKLKSEFPKNTGYHIRIAADYEEARRCLNDKLPDLIMQDINSTDVGELEFCRQIKAESATENIPIIAIIDYNNGKLKAAALEAGANDYVSKPIELSETTTRINTHLKMLSLQQKIDTQAEELIDEKPASKKSKKKANKAQVSANQYINNSGIIFIEY